MTKIIDRTGKGAAISQAEYDANLSSLHGINQSVTGTTFTVDNTDQGDTIECTNTGTCTVTLTAIATINGNIDTDDFKVTILAATASGGVTITRSSTDVIGVDADTSISLTVGQSVTLQTDSSAGVWNIVGSVGFSAPTVANHVRAGNTQIISGDNGSAGAAHDVGTDHTEDTMESVGPTGSGATNIWTALDILPSTARILLLDLHLGFTDFPSVGGAVVFYATDGDSSHTKDDTDNLMVRLYKQLTVTGATVVTDKNDWTGRIMIPLNSSQVFRAAWSDTSGDLMSSCLLYYRGFMTD